MSQRSVEWSDASGSPAASMKLSIAGTARPVVMRSLSMSGNTAFGSKARISTNVAPRWAAAVAGVSAPTGKGGSNGREGGGGAHVEEREQLQVAVGVTHVRGQVDRDRGRDHGAVRVDGALREPGRPRRVH